MGEPGFKPSFLGLLLDPPPAWGSGACLGVLGGCEGGGHSSSGRELELSPPCWLGRGLASYTNNQAWLEPFYFYFLFLLPRWPFLATLG